MLWPGRQMGEGVRLDPADEGPLPSWRWRQSQTLIRKGKSPAPRLLKARILVEGRCLGSGAKDEAIAGLSRLWMPARPWSTGCASFFHHIYAFTDPLEFPSRLLRSAFAWIRSAVPKPSVN